MRVALISIIDNADDGLGDVLGSGLNDRQFETRSLSNVLTDIHRDMAEDDAPGRHGFAGRNTVVGERTPGQRRCRPRDTEPASATEVRRRLGGTRSPCGAPGRRAADRAVGAFQGRVAGACTTTGRRPLARGGCELPMSPD